MPEETEPATQPLAGRDPAPSRDPAPTAEYPEVEPGTGAAAAGTGTGSGSEWSASAAGEQSGYPAGRAAVATRDSDPVPADDDPAEPRTRRRGRGGCLFWLAGTVALLLVLVLGTKIAGLWPHLHNPFATKTTDRSQPTLLLSIQDLSRFEAASGNFQVIIDVQQNTSFLPDIIFNDRVLFVAAGTVDAYVDFSNIGSGAITDSPDHKTATIKLPAPVLDATNIDEDRTYIYSQDRGLYQRVASVFSADNGKAQQLYKLGVQKIGEAAKSSDLAQRAATNTRKMLEQLLRSLGYTAITVTFANP